MTTQYTSVRHSYPKQDVNTAVSQTLSGLDANLFKMIRVGPAPIGSTSTGSNSSVRRWLYTTMVPGDQAMPDIELSWEADLAQGAIAERLAGPDQTNMADVLSGSQQQVVRPGGTMADLVGGAGDIAVGQYFASQESTLSDDQQVEQAKLAASTYGATETDAKVLRPLGPALYVVANFSDLSKLHGQISALQAAIVGDPPAYEGLYLEIDLNHEPIARTSQAFRTGAGRVWFAPGMDDELGIVHGSHP